jgi:hypothetical protein
MRRTYDGEIVRSVCWVFVHVSVTKRYCCQGDRDQDTFVDDSEVVEVSIFFTKSMAENKSTENRRS